MESVRYFHKRYPVWRWCRCGEEKQVEIKGKKFCLQDLREIFAKQGYEIKEKV